MGKKEKGRGRAVVLSRKLGLVSRFASECPDPFYCTAAAVVKKKPVPG